jgi:alkylated DNA repair dioxygenase AlkB
MSSKPRQLDLLGEASPLSLPEGVVYRPAVLSEDEERVIVGEIARLDLTPFQFRGFEGNRRTVSFGWRYDFNGGGFQKAAPIPEPFLPWRARAAALAGVSPESLEQVLAIEYSPGAGIGWHRDRPQFGIVAALSLLAPCRMRFRRKTSSGWERRSQVVAGRSGYVLDGPGRSEWEHSIPAVDALRYSLTFRTLKRSGES